MSTVGCGWWLCVTLKPQEDVWREIRIVSGTENETYLRDMDPEHLKGWGGWNQEDLWECFRNFNGMFQGPGVESDWKERKNMETLSKLINTSAWLPGWLQKERRKEALNMFFSDGGNWKMSGATVRIFCECREQRFSKVSHQPRAETDEESGEIRFDSKEITGIFQEDYERTSLVAKTLCSQCRVPGVHPWSGN